MVSVGLYSRGGDFYIYMIVNVHNFNGVLKINTYVDSIGFYSGEGDSYIHVLNSIQNFNCLLFDTTYINI